LKLQYDEPVSNFAFNFKLRRYTTKDNNMIGDKNWRLQDARESILKHAKAGRRSFTPD